MKNTKQQALGLAAAYPVTVRWSDEDQVFIGTVHELVGDCCHGDEPVKVFEEAREIAVECVEAALRDGDALPETHANPEIDPDPRSIRLALGLSQVKFASALGISPKTLHKWEQRTSRPSGAARTLLRIASMDPSAVRRALASL